MPLLLQSRPSYLMIAPIIVLTVLVLSLFDRGSTDSVVKNEWSRSNTPDRSFCISSLPRIDRGNSERLAACTRLIQSDPTNAEFYLYRAYNQNYNDDAAAADLHQAIKLDPNNAEAHYLHFDLFQDQESLSKAIRLHPTFFDALFNRSLCQDDSPSYAKQIGFISRAINLDPYNNVPYSYRCMWYYNSGDKTNARRDMCLSQRKQLWTDSSGTYDWTQEMCQELGNDLDLGSVGGAVGLLGRATDPDLETNGSSGEQQVRDSIKMLDEEIEQHGNVGDTFFVRAIARFTLNDIDGSLADINRAIALDGRTISGCVLRSILLLRKERYDDAQDDISYAIALAPNRPGLYFIRAQCSARLGQLKDAERDLLAGCMRSGVSVKDARYKIFAGPPVSVNPNFRHSAAEWF